MGQKTVSQGTQFEKSIKDTCAAYESAGIAYLEKVAPPSLVLRPPGRPPVVKLLPNPFLDFVGTWHTRGGRMIMMECKHTTEPTLSISDSSSGIKLKQLEACERWERTGAATCFLWRCASQGFQTRMVTPAMVRAQLTRRKSFRWCDAHPVPQGPGFMIIDFLALLGRIYPNPNPNQPTP